MAKRALKLRVPIPNFETDSRAWRRKMNEAIVEAREGKGIAYGSDDKLEVQIRFHLTDRKLTILDIDNRLKDVLDALQGFIGDKGKRKLLKPIIPNDNQIYRIVAEKRRPPKSDPEAKSIILIRKYDHHPGTAREPRVFAKHASR